MNFLETYHVKQDDEKNRMYSQMHELENKILLYESGCKLINDKI